jgi:serine O-acetyltransferase
MEKELRMDVVADQILLRSKRQVDKIDMSDMPDKNIIQTLVHSVSRLVMPDCAKNKAALSRLMENVFYHLYNQIVLALQYRDESLDKNYEQIKIDAEEICLCFFERLTQVSEYVETDMQAAFDGDPAAGSKAEICLAYPGLVASTVNRLAHELYLLGVPLVPRMMTEYAHSLTGIDIHPGATIGKYFFIDHGTGVVIGESTVVGDHVKLYQGVTLGALSTKGGQMLKNLKRHPTIEDHVTIYSGASILGGNTVIGHDCVIGGNVFITKSVPANTRVCVKNQELITKEIGGEGLQRQEFTQNEVWYYVI